ncbi:MAG: hypothetical protein K6D57_01920 [Paludibacteraceae bacterium]|nr:hypothetical protein [Paludibacteraceae bacterium]
MHNSALGLLLHPCLYCIVPLSNKLDILGRRVGGTDEGDAPTEFYMVER